MSEAKMLGRGVRRTKKATLPEEMDAEAAWA
jgi:hypothetical protein